MKNKIISDNKHTFLLITIVLSILLLILGVLIIRGKQYEIKDGEAATSDISLLVFSSRTENTNNGKDIYTIKSDGSGMKKITHTNDRGDEGAVISKDGKKIAFKSNRDDPTGKGNYEIYVMNVDGSDVKRLTNNPAHDQGPSWSPSGDRLAFGSDRTGNEDIHVMNSDGTNVRQITTSSAYERVPNWHPTQDKIAYSCRRGDDLDICVTDLNTNTEVNLTQDSPGDDAVASWSPDGTKIAYRRGKDSHSIWVMNADGTNKKQLTSDGMGPTWSPDGTKLAFSSNRSGDNGSEIYIMNADGSNQHKLISLPNSQEDDIDWGIFYDNGDDGPIASYTPTPPITFTPVLSPTPSDTPRFTPTPSNTPQFSLTPTVTQTPPVQPTITDTPNPIITVTPTPTHSLIPTNSITGNICGKSDVNNDGVFRIGDFTEFANAYGNGKNTCADKDVDYGPCGGRDVNRDGLLNISDFGGAGIGFAQRYFPKDSCSL